jgi:predicted transcriptional regulator YdeE
MQEYSHEAFEVTGYQFATNAQHAFEDISKAWEKINSQNILESVEHKTYPGLHNVYYNFTNQDDVENRGYDVLIGFVTDSKSEQTNPLLTTITIPAQDYKYETVAGEIPQSVVEK